MPVTNTPKTETTTTPPESGRPVLTDYVVLAALERAERHRQAQGPGALYSSLIEEVGFHSRHRAGPLKKRTDLLVQKRYLRRFLQNGCAMIALTPSGRRHLLALAKSGEAIQLPESRQHLIWRSCREAAQMRAPELRERLRIALDDAAQLLASDEVAPDAWYEVGSRLQQAAHGLNGALYCMRDWTEPDDSAADSPRSPRKDEEFRRAGAILLRARAEGVEPKWWDDD